jgi:ATP-dependent Clp protease ATP-binding subunit ClpA
MLLSVPTGFTGLEVSEVRRAVVTQIVEHLTAFPTGIILIDDIQTLREEHFKVLAPLLGRGPSRFVEAPEVPLNKATVILTSDFGKEGRTRGLNDQALRTIAEDTLREAFDHIDLRAVTTVPFKPFTVEYAKELIRHHVVTLPCRMNSVKAAAVSEEAISWLLRDMQEHDQITNENGRAISQRLSEAEVEAKLSEYFVEESVPADAELTVALDVADDHGRGRLVLRIQPPEGLAGFAEL